MTGAALKFDTECVDQPYGALSPTEFRRRVSYVRGHLDAVARMVEQGGEHAEVLRQMRAVRRGAEKLEAHCLMAYIGVDLKCLPPGSVKAITDLYRKVNR